MPQRPGGTSKAKTSGLVYDMGFGRVMQNRLLNAEAGPIHDVKCASQQVSMIQSDQAAGDVLTLPRLEFTRWRLP